MGLVNDGLAGTVEWQLLRTLRRNSGRFRTTALAESRIISKKTRKLQIAIDNLSITIIDTFTTLDLDILLQVEDEPEENANTKSSLQNLCSFLEARVNPELAPSQHATYPKPKKTAVNFPKLTLLAEYVESCQSGKDQLELIPIPGTHMTPFLFNISEDDDLAGYFVKLRNPDLKPPHKETRQRMLTEAKEARDFLEEFIRFVNKFRDSVASLGVLANRPSQETSSLSQTPVSLDSLRTFHRQASATFSAVFSHFAKCVANSPTIHTVFLQLPSLQHVFDCRYVGSQSKLPVKLAFKGCTHKAWQPADSYLLPSENASSYRQQTVCKALSNAQINGNPLELYVLEPSESNGYSEPTLHVTKDPCGWKKTKDFKFPTASLWKLISRDFFKRSETDDFMVETDFKGRVFQTEQRKLLAIKVILGLMLSMDSDRCIATWNPERVYSFDSSVVHDDNDLPVFVSVLEAQDEENSEQREKLSLSEWDFSKHRGDDNDLLPLAPFTFLAKFFLQMAGAGELRSIEISGNAMDDTPGRISLLKLIDLHMERVTNGRVEIAPFLSAATHCLNFHLTFQKYAREAQSENRLTLAWKLVFEHIISKIDNTFVLEDDAKDEAASIQDNVTDEQKPPEIMKAGVMLELEHPDTAVHEVALFDGEPAVEGSLEAQQAKKFFSLLDNFHDSYSRDVINRATESGAESPRRVRVAVLDTGIDFGHPEIMAAEASGRIRREWCHSMVGDEGKIEDEDPGLHGTNCVLLLHKAAPEADIYVEKISTGTNMRTYHVENIAKAINHVMETWHVDIISMSFGLRRPRAGKDGNEAEDRKALDKHLDIIDGMRVAIRKASDKAILFAAASNDGRNGKRTFPASYDPHVICVNASTGDGVHNGISPDPVKDTYNFMTLGVGVEMIVKDMDNAKRRKPRQQNTPAYQKVYRSGTSFATPIAAGIAATVLDIAMRVEAVSGRTERELRSPSGMRQFLRKMAASSPEVNYGTGSYYLAPWTFWEENWQADEVKRRTLWDSMNSLFRE